MSKTIKLLAMSLLLIGCKGMYGDNMGETKKGHSADKHAAKHATDHISQVNRSVAASASATTTLAKQLP